jgi:hypothetical protein
MPIVTTNFIAGRMNQSVDERLVPPGEYIEALNVRLGATETTEIGALENSKGNTQITTLLFNNTALTNAECIGAYDDGANETMYWFVTSDTADMIVSFDTKTTLLNYHVSDAGNVLNFDPKYLITGIDKIGDLLFFTDDKNPPRKINITRSYPNVTAEDINVIVQPPLSAPTMSLFSQATEANYMETRMICFAYRYQYIDEEYSAISQFTEVAFSPGVFSLDASTNLNAGMKNIYNSVLVSFDVGGKNVKGLDLIFKFSDSNTLNVIEKFNKADQGWSDDSVQTQTFSNNKIYSVLPESELLRLYDNVPLLAKAQTIMGNRLVYGNYVDGRNIIDSNGVNTDIGFAASLNTKAIDIESIPTTFATGVNYTIDSAQSIPASAVILDFSSVSSKLKTGSFLGIDITYIKNKYSGNDGTVTGSQGATAIDTTFTLDQDFGTVYEMASSDSFQARIGSLIFQTVTNCSAGTSLTDSFNCTIENPADTTVDITWSKFDSGITGLGQGIKITTAPGSNLITLQLLAMQFVDVDAAGGTAAPLYGYYNFVSADVQFLNNSSIQSLHSNRNYEIGMVYLDEYLRATTALVSGDIDPTIFVPATNSISQSTIAVNIPITQKPPFWATKYKFVIKRAEGPYETIYSNFYYSDSTDNSVYFKLEGQNQNKTQTGDILRIKSDSQGPRTTLSTAEVLSIEAKAQNFLTPTANFKTGDIEPFISELPGLYMQMKPTSFSVDTSDSSSFFDTGLIAVSFRSPRSKPAVKLECFEESLNGETKTILAIPVSSLVSFDIEFARTGSGGAGAGCGQVIYRYKRTFQASTNYDNLFAFVNGENIDFTGGFDETLDDGGANKNIYNSTIRGDSFPSFIRGTNQYQFGTSDGQQPTSANDLVFYCVSGTSPCSGGRRAAAQGRIQVQLADSLMIFETTPIDVDGDLYFENDAIYDITGGFHMGGTTAGDQNQTAVLPAIITTGFFDCYSFGNGVESFKVQDSLVGQSLSLGQRQTSVSQQDFKEADRFAGLTYSGTFNDENNINKLNEFNLGLVNFKDLEVIYGPIEILHGRETDILVLQEDKISYVLAGKNLLSSAAAGGAITNTAEVLGTQIARIEEFGISNNPESFVSYGFDKYFTDSKRNVVLRLQGNGQSEQLTVISETGMRGFFRDLFTSDFGTQKLGGYDPYMNEYVLSSNSTAIPTAIVPISCGSTIARQNVTDASSYTLNLGTTQGSVVFTFQVTGTVNLSVVWNSVGVINQNITGNSTVAFIKTLPNPTTAVITITPSGNDTFNIVSACPVAPPLIIRQLTLGSPADEGKFIHNEFYWTQGSFNSPVSSELIQFNQDTANIGGVYNETSGKSSIGVFPPSGATIMMQSNKKDFDDFVFDPAIHKFRRLVTPFDYTPAQWVSVEGNSTDVVPITNPSTGLYQASFTYNNPSNFTYLYLTWDLRTATSVDLRHGSTTSIACCSGPTDTYFIDTNSFATATAVFTDSSLHTPATNEFYQISNTVREQVGSPSKLLPGQSCLPCGTSIPLCFATTADEVCCTGCVYTGFSSSVLATTRNLACGLSLTVTYFHNGGTGAPVVNNFVYSDNKGTTKLSVGYYKISATQFIYVDNSGMILNLLTC